MLTHVLAGVLLTLPLLQGCFPLAVTGVGSAALMASDAAPPAPTSITEGIERKRLSALRRVNGRCGHVTPTPFKRPRAAHRRGATEDCASRAEESMRAVPNVHEVTNRGSESPALPRSLARQRMRSSLPT